MGGAGGPSLFNLADTNEINLSHMCMCFIALIGISLVLGFLQSWTERKAFNAPDKLYIHFFEHLTQELTILGTISLIIFFCEQYFALNTTDYYFEIELAHLAIFFSAAAMVFLAMFYAITRKSTTQNWDRSAMLGESDCIERMRAFTEERQRRGDSINFCVNLSDFLRWSKLQASAQLLTFKFLFLTYQPLLTADDQNFDYVAYLDKGYVHEIIQLVHTSQAVWATMVAFICANWFVADDLCRDAIDQCTSQRTAYMLVVGYCIFGAAVVVWMFAKFVFPLAMMRSTVGITSYFECAPYIEVLEAIKAKQAQDPDCVYWTAADSWTAISGVKQRTAINVWRRRVYWLAYVIRIVSTINKFYFVALLCYFNAAASWLELLMMTIPSLLTALVIVRRSLKHCVFIKMFTNPNKAVMGELCEEHDQARCAVIDVRRQLGVYCRENKTSFVDVFRQWDKSGDGEIDMRELGEGLAKLGICMSRRRLMTLIRVMDPDRSNTVNQEEFMEVVQPSISKTQKRDSGSIRDATDSQLASEVRHLLESLSDHEESKTGKQDGKRNWLSAPERQILENLAAVFTSQLHVATNERSMETPGTHIAQALDVDDGISSRFMV